MKNIRLRDFPPKIYNQFEFIFKKPGQPLHQHRVLVLVRLRRRHEDAGGSHHREGGSGGEGRPRLPREAAAAPAAGYEEIFSGKKNLLVCLCLYIRMFGCV